MAVEIGPALGLTADSKDLEIAVGDLKAVAAAAKQAETAAKSLEGKTRGVSSAMKEAAATARESNTALAQQTAKQRESAQAAAELARKQKEAQAQAAQAASSYSVLRASLDPLYATSKRYESALETLNAAQSAGVISDAERTRTLGILDAQFEMASLSSKKLAGSTAYTSNVFAQFNDIGMMAFSGQSPMMLAIQQGTQLNQVFAEIQRSGGGAKAIFSTMGQALSSMISPTSLLTLGLIAGGAALVQWGMSAIGAGENTKTLRENVDELKNSVSEMNTVASQYSAEGIQQMIDKYGEVNSEILAMIENQRAFSEATAMAKAKEAIAGLVSEYGSIVSAMERARVMTADLYGDLGLTRQQYIALGNAMREASSATTFEGQASALRKVNEILSVSKVKTTEVAGAALKAEDAMHQLAASAPAASWMNAAINGVSALGAAIRARIGEAIALRNAATQQLSALPDERGSQRRIVHDATGFVRDNALKDTGGSAGGGSGGGGGSSDRQTSLDALIQSLQTERETVEAWHAEQLASLATFSDAELAAIGGTNEAKIRLEAEYQERLRGLKSGYQGDALSQASTFFGQLQDATQSGTDGMLRISRVAGAAEALINAYVAGSQVLRDPKLSWWQKIPAAFSIIGAGMGMANAIKGGSKSSGSGAAAASSGGSSGGSSSGQQSTATETPLRVSLDAIDPSASYTGAAIQKMFEAIQKEAGNRGIVWVADGMSA